MYTVIQVSLFFKGFIMKKQFILSALLITASTAIFTNNPPEQNMLTSEQEQQMSQQLMVMAHQILTILSNPDLSDEYIVRFAQETFDNASDAQIRNTEEEILNSLFVLHYLIHAFDFSSHATTIVHNLERVAKVTTDKHMIACITFIEKYAIDLSDPNLFNQ